MSWEDRLQPASFRGVSFFYEKVESTVGRRTSVKEFPGRDNPVVEDLGRSARRFDITAYILGDDYDIDRDELIAAIEDPRPGRLVHPYWGDRNVRVVGRVKFTETVKERRMARFSISFVDAGDPLQPLRRRDKRDETKTTATVAATNAADDLNDDLTTTGITGTVRDAAKTIVTESQAVIKTVKGKVNAALNLVDDVIEDIDAISDEITTLINAPRILAERIQGVLADVMGSITAIPTAIEQQLAAGEHLTVPFSDGPLNQRYRSDVMMIAMRSLIALNNNRPIITTAVSGTQAAIEVANQAALTIGYKAAAIIETARAASDLTYESFDQASAVRDELSTEIRAMLLDASDVTYAGLLDLHTKLLQFLTDTAEELPRINDYTPIFAMPALVIANELYGDADRDFEINERNNLRHPGFVFGGTAIKVLGE